MFVPVKVTVGAGGSEQTTLYSRGIDVVGERLRTFELHARDMREPLATIGGALRDIVGGQFASEGAAGAAGRWKQLSEPYGSWKQSKVAGVPILVGIRPSGGVARSGGKGKQRRRGQTYAPSGQMRRELLDPLATHVTARRMLYAPVSDIAGYHQTGTSRMPARPPVDPRLSDLRTFDRAFTAWLAGLIEKGGL